MKEKTDPSMKAGTAGQFRSSSGKAARLMRKGRVKVRPFTIVLLFVFLLVLTLAYFILTDPHFLDSINEAILGARPIVAPSIEEISRWTKTPTFDQSIDESIRQRFLAIPPLDLPISDTGKANPFVAVTP